MTAIVSDDAVRSGDPRIEGSRITVFDVKRRVIDNGEDPHVVAGEYDLSMADVFRALAYYYDHEALKSREREAERSRREGERTTRDLIERAERADASERAD